MKRKLIGLAAVFLMIISAAPVWAEDPGTQRVFPGESFFGFVNQDFFAAFDTGIDGAYIDPLYGEVIAPDSETVYFTGNFDGGITLVAEQKADLLRRLFAGEQDILPESGSPEQRLLDLYELFHHADTDQEKDDTLFSDCIAPLLAAETVDQFLDAVSDVYELTGVNVLLDMTAAQEADTNETLLKIRLNAPSWGAKVAYDPVAEPLFADMYTDGMGEFLLGLGFEADSESLQQAYALQAAILSGQNYTDDFFNMRSERSGIEGETYTRDDRRADIARLDELHPDRFTFEYPEGISESEERIMHTKVSKNVFYNHAVTIAELQEVNGSFQLAEMLSRTGFDVDRVIITPADYAVFSEVQLNEENLEAFKINAVLLLSEALQFTPSSATGGQTKMQRAVACAEWGSETAPETEPEEFTDEFIMEQVAALLPQEAGLLWADFYYDASLTEPVENLVKEICAAYHRIFESNTWLNDDEKAMMIAKVDNVVPVIGIPTEDNCVFAEILPESAGGTLLSARIGLKKADMKLVFRMVTEEWFIRRSFQQPIPVAFGIWVMTADTVNAASNSTYNSFVMPAGIISVMAQPDMDETELLAAVGFVAAHEIGHLFDEAGSDFDDQGRIVNWWSDETRQMFMDTVTRFEDHYGRFFMVEGVHQDFDGRMGEAMADFAAAEAVFEVIGDDTEKAQTFMETLASRCWVLGTKAGYIEAFGIDEHPAEPLRINALISNFSRFYEVYDVREGDPMYTAPESRLTLW